MSSIRVFYLVGFGRQFYQEYGKTKAGRKYASYFQFERTAFLNGYLAKKAKNECSEKRCVVGGTTPTTHLFFGELFLNELAEKTAKIHWQYIKNGCGFSKKVDRNIQSLIMQLTFMERNFPISPR